VRRKNCPLSIASQSSRSIRSGLTACHARILAGILAWFVDAVRYGSEKRSSQSRSHAAVTSAGHLLGELPKNGGAST
jgi:hypothetical protein